MTAVEETLVIVKPDGAVHALDAAGSLLYAMVGGALAVGAIVLSGK